MKLKHGQRVPMDQCIKGRLYRIGCRNLSLGVYDGNEGFVGIRHKFNSRFLDTEYHFDQGPPYGTVHTVMDTKIDVPNASWVVGRHGGPELFEWLERQHKELGVE